MKKTYKSILILVTLVSLLILYLINSNIIVEAILDYSILFLTVILFILFVCNLNVSLVNVVILLFIY